jgi:hypothetical protein
MTLLPLVAFGQAALEILIVSRLYEKTQAQHTSGDDGGSFSGSMRNPTPFNFTCLNEKWVQETTSLPEAFYSQLLGPGKPRNTEYAFWGCNNGADWSCDFKFEKALRSVGFHGWSTGFHMPLSSFSQGCANDFIPDFHVTSETARRPRLHVGFCSRLDEIQGTEFKYDGPLGGGNDFVRRSAVNGWLINHKVQINFYEAFRDPAACRKSDTFARSCDVSLVASMIEKKSRKVSMEVRVRAVGGVKVKLSVWLLSHVVLFSCATE